MPAMLSAQMPKLAGRARSYEIQAPKRSAGHVHQRRRAGFDRGGVGQGARQDAGEIEARGFTLGLP